MGTNLDYRKGALRPSIQISIVPVMSRLLYAAVHCHGVRVLYLSRDLAAYLWLPWAISPKWHSNNLHWQSAHVLQIQVKWKWATYFHMHSPTILGMHMGDGSLSGVQGKPLCILCVCSVCPKQCWNEHVQSSRTVWCYTFPHTWRGESTQHSLLNECSVWGTLCLCSNS
jgi:hypothetical protein